MSVVRLLKVINNQSFDSRANLTKKNCRISERAKSHENKSECNLSRALLEVAQKVSHRNVAVRGWLKSI